MSLFEVGQLCLKLAGRDAGRKGVVVEAIDERWVLIDGDLRRKKVNIKHLEPLAEKIELKNKASHEEVKKAFEKLSLGVWEKKSKKSAPRPRKLKKKKVVSEGKLAQKAGKAKISGKNKSVTEGSVEEVIAEK